MYAAFFALGTFTVALALVFLNAFFPMLVIEDDLIVIFLREVHLKNAFLPIVVTLAPIVSFLMSESPLNALAAIDVTLNV